MSLVHWLMSNYTMITYLLTQPPKSLFRPYQTICVTIVCFQSYLLCKHHLQIQLLLNHHFLRMIWFSSSSSTTSSRVSGQCSICTWCRREEPEPPQSRRAIKKIEIYHWTNNYLPWSLKSSQSCYKSPCPFQKFPSKCPTKASRPKPNVYLLLEQF